MNSKRWLAGIGIVGIAVAVPSCNGSGKEGANGTDQVNMASKADLKALRDSLETLLGSTPGPNNLNQWLKDLATGVCQLEKKAPTGWALNEADRFCKAAGTPDKTSPPAFPPK